MAGITTIDTERVCQVSPDDDSNSKSNVKLDDTDNDMVYVNESVEDFELEEEETANQRLRMSDIQVLDEHQRVRLSWDSINVSTQIGKQSILEKCLPFGRKKQPYRKQILFDVAGVVKPGTLLAIMGSSGAGKTTLLNVLAHRNIQSMEVDGIVRVNRKIVGRRIKRYSAYVQQEDEFVGTLTAREHLIFQATLRIDGSLTKEEKIARVDSVIAELGMTKCKDTTIGIPGRLRGLSGGELKRLSFASEILTNPLLLFVDEPTSGLDSFMALSVISSLQQLANSGRTILATIHQPSSEVFAMFDSILLMSEGRVAYMGPTKDCISFFNQCGYILPANYNPSDFFIKALAIVPGSEEDCRRRALEICTAFKNRIRNRKASRSLSSTSFVQETDLEQHKYKVGFMEQIRMLAWRSSKKLQRDPLMNWVKLTQRVIIGIVAGLVYFQIENNQASIRNFAGILFFFVLQSAMSSYGPSMLTIADDFPIFMKEHKIAMYRVDAFFLITSVAEMPINLVGQLIFSIIIYWMSGLRPDAGAFFTFFGICFLVLQCSLSYAYFVSALIPNIKVLAAFGTLLIFPFIMFGGLFINVGAIPVYFIWLQYLSFFKYGYEALSINQWSGIQSVGCPVNSTVPCLKTGQAVLESFGFSEDRFYVNIYALIGIMVGFRLLAFLVVFIRAWKK